VRATRLRYTPKKLFYHRKPIYQIRNLNYAVHGHDRIESPGNIPVDNPKLVEMLEFDSEALFHESAHQKSTTGYSY
jgi:hypothetical protein